MTYRVRITTDDDSPAQARQYSGLTSQAVARVINSMSAMMTTSGGPARVRIAVQED